MEDEFIEALRAALDKGHTVLWAPNGDLNEAKLVSHIGTWAGNPEAGEDPEPGPVAYTAEGRGYYVALFGSYPAEWFVVKPLFKDSNE